MDKAEYLKDAVNYVMMLRGLPYNTRAWVEQHMGENPEQMIKEAIPAILRNDERFLQKCLEEFRDYIEKHPQTSESF